MASLIRIPFIIILSLGFYFIIVINLSLHFFRALRVHCRHSYFVVHLIYHHHIFIIYHIFIRFPTMPYHFQIANSLLISYCQYSKYLSALIFFYSFIQLIEMALVLGNFMSFNILIRVALLQSYFLNLLNFYIFIQFVFPQNFIAFYYKYF